MEHYPRLVRSLNLSIAVLALASLAFGYWKIYRPLPQTTGEVAAPLSGEAEIRRDSRGIPHITASTVEDAIFLQGYAMAQDRLFQMDAMRRLAAGELAELVGTAAVEVDREARQLRMRRIAEDHARTLPPADRAVLAAFARGVNHFVETHRDKLPIEFTLLRYQPRPWTVADSILAGLQMFRNLTTTWKHELQKHSLLEKGDKAKIEYLYPPRSGTEVQPGSNAWAVAGSHTASGKPILANDPHIEFGVPAPWYMVQMTAPGLNVEGVTLAGVPCVIIGHNDDIAWGVTNLGFDVQDLYLETIVPAGVLFKGKPAPTRVEQEVILVKGGKPVVESVAVTAHGPAVQMLDGKLVTLRWTGAEPGSFQFPFLDLNLARNWNEFRDALRRFPGPGQNFVFASRDGSIGYQATGLLPIRHGYNGDVPVDGASGDYEWDGFIPFDELPTAYNPADGYVVTANQNPFPTDYRYTVHGDFSPPYRANQIRDLLRAGGKWAPAGMITIQKDVYSPFSSFIARQVVEAFDRAKPTNPAFPPAISLLRNWNGQMEKGTAAPLLAALLYQHIKKAVVESAAPGKTDVYQDQMSHAVIERLLRERPAGWFKNGYDEMLFKALDGALEEGRKLQGTSDVTHWDYGPYNQLQMLHPVLGHVGDAIPLVGELLNSFVGSYANIGPVPMSGSSTTVKQTTRRLGPSMRFVADLSNWDQSLLGITVGESGQIGSSHYKDQWESYYFARGTPFAFSKQTTGAVLRVRPQR